MMRWAVAFAALCAVACASQPPPATSQSVGVHRGVSLERVAVAAFVEAPRIDRPGARSDVEPEGATVIRSRVVEALAESEIDHVPPEEVDLWLKRADVDPGASPEVLALHLSGGFGVDGVLVGRVRRYTARVGGAGGARQPAAVWFELSLHDREGQRLWTGSYREEQRAVSDDLLSLPRALERGFEWVDAPRLAEYGARELMRQLVEERTRWR